MKCLIFDSGPVISLSLNNLLWLIPELRKDFGGHFLISRSVEKELIDNPLSRTKRFILEALNVMSLVASGDLNVARGEGIKEIYDKIDHSTNKAFSSGDSYITLMHPGEIETIAITLKYKAEGIVVDERNTRLLIEEPKTLKKILEKKLHRKIRMEEYRIKEFQDLVKDVKVIRSAELVAVAYEKGIIQKNYPAEIRKIERNFEKFLLEGVLWGVKLRGCSVSDHEIEAMKKSVMKAWKNQKF
jgi:hypothetical protein